MASISTSSVYRITGLASGLDIDQMVSELMKAQRAPLTKLLQTKQIWQWKQEDYRKINTSLLNLRNVAFNLKLQGTFQVKKAVSSDESIVTATAAGSAVPTTYQVKVKQLATVATNVSAAPLQRGIIGGPLTTPVQINENDTLTISYNGTEATITLKMNYYDGSPGNTLNDLVADIQAKIDAALGKRKVLVSLFVDNDGNKLKLTPLVATDGSTPPKLAVKGGSALSVLGLQANQEAVALDPNAPLISEASKFTGSFSWDNESEHTFSFTINGQKFTFDADNDSLNKIIATVNANTAAGVSMFYDPATDRIAISTIKTGDNRAGA
ncbi:MAG: flagellar filament capping protein FliD, partial [Thermacetogeniaceae bacterium]